ncbi:hypothetical protein AJ79_04222 [Helicocarpus griseus UAMH5409]|uniref:Major facilitator superfamily (MFS) profile domain-containing protein n=1 Tax=Helicocarpus griseus UAMH5409 TaxID=1447875 RepID=A0A2B7XV70_9EURO|nr:hypothetical protein AJ79_04222 [Helicocarpus griseus UAMH5409]
MPTVVGNVFGSARVSVAMGMIVTSWAGAPIAGYILDASGGENGGNAAFRPAILYAGFVATGATALVAYARLKVNKNPFRKF